MTMYNWFNDFITLMISIPKTKSECSNSSQIQHGALGGQITNH